MTLSAKIMLGVLIELYIICHFGNAYISHRSKVNSAIGCFVCSSRNGSHLDCEDPFNPGFFNTSYVERCKTPKRNHVGEFPAHFCIKVIGRSYETNEKIVVRRCTTATMDNQCGNFQFEDDLLRGCILTCDIDGCNSSKSIDTSAFFILYSVLFSISIVKATSTSSWH